jgi:hypothetical protein
VHARRRAPGSSWTTVAVAGRARVRPRGPRATARERKVLARSPGGPSPCGLSVWDGGEAGMFYRHIATWATCCGPPAQRRSVRVDRRIGLVPVDLPVDCVVVLEQEERAGQIQRSERSLGKG